MTRQPAHLSSFLLWLTAAAGAAAAQRAERSLPIVGEVHAYTHHAGGDNPSSDSVLVDDHVVRAPGAAWIQVGFEQLSLPEGSLLEIQSLSDGDVEVLDHDFQRRQSAYFNGGALRLRLFAGPGTRGTVCRIRDVARSSLSTRPNSQCGPTDDRKRSSDKRVARLLVKRGSQVSVCTGWLFGINCFGTAGRCLIPKPDSVTAQFDVPSSTTSGAMQNPPASKQYSMSGYTARDTGLGDDWGVFNTLANPITRQHAAQDRGDRFFIATKDDRVTLILTGHGADSSPWTSNFAQQSHTGLRVLRSGNVMRYRIDTHIGSYGSPVIKDGTKEVVAVHTDDGCSTSNGATSNAGTYVRNFGFLIAQTARCAARPDLIVASASTESSRGTLYPGHVYRGSSVVKNIGSAKSGSFRRDHRMSANRFISSADILLASPAAEPGLDPGAVQAAHYSYRMPVMDPTRAVPCWFGARADTTDAVAELDETNNTLAGAQLTCAAPLADLVVDRISAPPVLEPGATISISARIVNTGALRATVTGTTFHLSRDSKLSSDDLLLASALTPAIDPASSATVSRNATLPIDLAEGPCYLIVVADSTNGVREYFENNQKIVGRQCSAKPDLIVTVLATRSTTLTAGSLHSVQSTIRNQGGLSAGLSTASYYLSADSVITTADTLLGNQRVSVLAPNTAFSSSMNLRIPASTSTGRCWLGIIADRGNVIDEVFEGQQNTRSLERSCVARADLVVQTLSASTLTWQPNATVAVTTAIRNAGAATAPSSTATLYMSTDSTITTTDTFLADRFTAGLLPNQTHNLTQNVRLPLNLSLGTCWLGVIADRTAVVTEAFEDNNTRALEGTCALGKPDLSVTLSAPKTIGAGTSATIVSTTRNSGQGPAASSTSALLLSTDQMITTSDVLLGSYATGQLAPSASKTVSAAYPIPRCTPGGTCFVAAMADLRGEIIETDESNNVAVQLRTCTPVGSGRWTEFVPRSGSAAQTPAEAKFSLAGSVRAADMCVYAPQLPGRWYLCVWSASPTVFVNDALTGFSLTFLNTPMFHQWFGRLDAAGRGAPAIRLPKTALGGTVVAWTHTIYLSPALQLVGFGSNRIRNQIDP